MAKYKNASSQKVYDAMLDAAFDVRSELYVEGKPHRGAAHRCAFWDGYAGVVTSANVVPKTLSAVAFAAGKAFFRAMPEAIAVEDALWTPGVTRQGVASTQGSLVTPRSLAQVRKVHLAQLSCGARASKGPRRHSIHANEVTCARCLAALRMLGAQQNTQNSPQTP